MVKINIDDKLVAYSELVPGQYFVMQGKPSFPKKVLPPQPNGDPGGYFDFEFGTRNLMPNKAWVVMPYTEDEAKKVLLFINEGDEAAVAAKLEKVKQYE
jgi:hypothetical protein